VLLALSSAIQLSGCTRHFFRTRADKEVADVLVEKDKYPDWRIEQYHVYPDERARFADPTNPDRPPKPPDDPAAYDLAPNPQKPGHAGIASTEGQGYLKLMAYWDEMNREEAAARKKEKEGSDKSGEAKGEGKDKAGGEAEAKTEGQKGGYGAAGTTASAVTSLTVTPKPGERPPYLLKLDQAVELGLINSREYQDARENLYLTALPVTLERFAFSAQFFFVEQAIREFVGSEQAGGGATPAAGGGRGAAATGRNDWTLGSNTGFSKLFSTGALLLFNFANQTVFNLTGQGRALTSQSTINLDIVQPLLRGGGRAVTLEPLTQAERNLVYQIRDYARFRKTFYVAIAGGGGGSITGAAFQPTGVLAAPVFTPGGGVGISPLVPGVIPAVRVTGEGNLLVNPGTAGRLSLNVALSGTVSGYLTTLLQAAQVQVDLYNIDKLEGFLRLARALQEGGDISQLQTDQFEQSLLRGRTSLLMDQQQYLQSLDQFKIQLGLPTNLPIELDDAPFRPLTEQFQRYEDLFTAFNAASNEPLRFGTLELVPKVRGELRRIFTTSDIVRETRFRTEIQAVWGAWEKLAADDLRKQLARYGEERRKLLDRKTDLEAKGQDLSPTEQQRLDRLNFEISVGEFEAVLRDYEGQPWKDVADPELRRRRQQAAYRYVVNAFILVLAEARNERIVKLRNSWPDLRKLCVNRVDLLKADLADAEAEVVRVALANRLDLMNVRAQVVDAWRQLAVFANALLGTFNVAYHLDSSTPAGLAQPLDFNAHRSRHQLILNTDLPLVRTSERNAYRAALINYQRSRRILQRAEDQVMFDVRGELRQLRQQYDLYLIQQRQLELSYQVVENALDTFQAPPAAGAAAGDPATRAATLTQQLITAQTNLFNAQTQMTTIWITYLNTRLQLYRDMELMPLDERGSWIDNIEACECPPADQSKQDKAPAGEGGKPPAEQLPAPRPQPERGGAAPR
jgi:outer membrane protein TolC